MSLFRNPYLLIVTNLFCNHKCSYCIQQKSSLDVRQRPEKVDVDQVLKFLKRNRIAKSVSLMGGEATLHPDFEKLMDGLVKLYPKIVFTTNVNGKWYKDFDLALKKMSQWKDNVRWSTTYHAAWMDCDLYIERIRKMKEAGFNMEQVAATDTSDLPAEEAEKLFKADIGWKMQTFTGRAPDGRLVPQTLDDISLQYPQTYDPMKYIEHYQEYTEECEDSNYTNNFLRKEWVNCTTHHFLIGPDNNVYPCHRHLYVYDKMYKMGDIHDVEMKNFKSKLNRWTGEWTLPCHTKCNPCDFKAVKIKSTGRMVRQPNQKSVESSTQA